MLLLQPRTGIPGSRHHDTQRPMARRVIRLHGASDVSSLRRRRCAYQRLGVGGRGLRSLLLGLVGNQVGQAQRYGHPHTRLGHLGKVHHSSEAVWLRGARNRHRANGNEAIAWRDRGPPGRGVIEVSGRPGRPGSQRHGLYCVQLGPLNLSRRETSGDVPLARGRPATERPTDRHPGPGCRRPGGDGVVPLGGDGEHVVSLR